MPMTLNSGSSWHEVKQANKERLAALVQARMRGHLQPGRRCSMSR